MKRGIAAGMMTALGAVLYGCAPGEDTETQNAKAQLAQLVADYDSETTVTGAFQRPSSPRAEDKGYVLEADPWGTEIRMYFAREANAEQFTVKSAGPDKSFGTADDLALSGHRSTFSQPHNHAATPGAASGAPATDLDQQKITDAVRATIEAAKKKQEEEQAAHPEH